MHYEIENKKSVHCAKEHQGAGTKGYSSTGAVPGK